MTAGTIIDQFKRECEKYNPHTWGGGVKTIMREK